MVSKISLIAVGLLLVSVNAQQYGQQSGRRNSQDRLNQLRSYDDSARNSRNYNDLYGVVVGEKAGQKPDPVARFGSIWVFDCCGAGSFLCASRGEMKLYPGGIEADSFPSFTGGNSYSEAWELG
uniref:Uncharacterized protein n=1 Tax=Anopheles christyi TaxID=43041 RepID=A0A182K7J5_9DIPT